MLLGVVSGGWWYSSNVSEDPEGTTTDCRLRASGSQVSIHGIRDHAPCGSSPVVISLISPWICILYLTGAILFNTFVTSEKNISPRLQSSIPFVFSLPPCGIQRTSLGSHWWVVTVQRASCLSTLSVGLQAPPSLMQDFYPCNSGQFYKKSWKRVSQLQLTEIPSLWGIFLHLPFSMDNSRGSYQSFEKLQNVPWLRTLMTQTHLLMFHTA